MAKKMAKYLGIKFKENIEVDDYPCIKCNIGRDMYGETKIYHLPFDQQYDSTKISKKGEFYAMTCNAINRFRLCSQALKHDSCPISVFWLLP